jgi:hypothetical protein
MSRTVPGLSRVVEPNTEEGGPERCSTSAFAGALPGATMTMPSAGSSSRGAPAVGNTSARTGAPATGSCGAMKKKALSSLARLQEVPTLAATAAGSATGRGGLAGGAGAAAEADAAGAAVAPPADAEATALCAGGSATGDEHATASPTAVATEPIRRVRCKLRVTPSTLNARPWRICPRWAKRRAKPLARADEQTGFANG